MALIQGWRNQEWIPLFSQQLRLRNLTQILAYNLLGQRKTHPAQFYFTLHLTSKSAPIYSSESCRGPNPRWEEIDFKGNANTLCGTGVVVRIWQCGTTDELLTVLGIHLSGLMPAPPETDLSKELGPNSLVFILHGFPFIVPQNKTERVTKAEVPPSAVRSSYSVPRLLKLHHVQLDIAHHAAISESLKQTIQRIGPFPPSSGPSGLIGPPNQRYKAQQLIAAREEARHRIWLLRGERARRAAVVANLRVQAEKLEEEIQETSSDLAVRYKDLSREVERLRESQSSLSQTRELFIYTMSHLANRRRQLITQLKYIYPINQEESGMKICGVPLMSSEVINLQDESSSAVALGFAVHATVMVATFLDVPLRYPVISAGSRARIWDMVAPKLPDSEREFPLFSRGRDKIQFSYAVYLLNKDIAQLRWYCGLGTRDLRSTLLNLRDLLNMRSAPISTYHRRTHSGSSQELTSSHLSLYPQQNDSSEEQKPKGTRVKSEGVPIRAKVSEQIMSSQQNTSGSLESWDVCYLEPPSPKHNLLEKEQTLSCSLDKGLDTLKRPHYKHQTLSMLSANKSTNISEPSLVIVPKDSQKQGCDTTNVSFEHVGDKSPEIQVHSTIIVDSINQEIVLDTGIDSKVVEDGVVELNNAEESNSNNCDEVDVFIENTVQEAVSSVVSESNSHENGVIINAPVKNRTFSDNEEFHDCLPNPEPTTSQEICDSNIVLNKVDSIDNLFANVTSRTEALASRSGSFNLVKSRASTMESS